MIDNRSLDYCAYAGDLGRPRSGSGLAVVAGLLLSDLRSGQLEVMGVIVTDELPADPLDALRELARTEAELDELRRAQVGAARAAGATWEQVGEALGISRQSAWEYHAAGTRAELAANAAANTELSDDDAMDLADERSGRYAVGYCDEEVGCGAR